MSNANTKENVKTKTVTIVKPRTIVPRMWKVLLHNNDFTSFEAVMAILVNVFKKGNQEASQIMMTAHVTGVGVVIRSTKDVCEAKIQEVTQYVQAHENDMLFGDRSHYFGELVFTAEEDE